MSTQATTVSTDSGHRLAHNPALDGIRGVAVAAMMLYHSGNIFETGGFLSIDTFFVLSGYLITSLLLVEWSKTGTIAMGTFWARRARRLLPALFLMLAGIGIYATLFAHPTELGRIRSDGLASFGYVANWRFVFSGQSYFDHFNAPSPMRHLWSLAVEEQFYLIWPMIVFGVLKWRRGSARTLLGVIVTLMVASAALMAILYHPGTDPSRVYYGTDTRAQSLLLGAALGTILFLKGPIRNLYMRGAIRVLAVVGAVYTVWSWTSLPESTDALYRGGFLVSSVATAFIITSVVQADGGVLYKILSLKPITWVGKVSYGLYLWHWPVYLVVTPVRTGLDGLPLLVVRLAITVTIATLSFYLVEQPIRYGALGKRLTWSLTPIGAVAVVVILVLSTTGARQSIAQATLTSLGKGPPPTAPVSNDGAVDQEPTRVLVVGDSVVATMAIGLERAAAANSLLVWNKATFGCGLSRAGEVLEGGETRTQSYNCNDWPTRWGQLLDQFPANEVVLLPGGRDVLDRKINGTWVRLGTPEHDAYFLGELEQAVTLLSSRGANVVLLTMPYFSRPDLTVNDPMRWIEYEPWRVDRINTLLRTWVGQHPDKARILDMNSRVSPGGKYADYINDVLVRADGVHFSSEGADYVASWLAPRLRDIGTGVTRVRYPGVTVR